MMDSISVEGFRAMDVVVAAVYDPMILDIILFVCFIFAAATFIGFGCTDSTGTLSPVISTRLVSISGSKCWLNPLRVNSVHVKVYTSISTSISTIWV